MCCEQRSPDSRLCRIEKTCHQIEGVQVGEEISRDERTTPYPPSKKRK